MGLPLCLAPNLHSMQDTTPIKNYTAKGKHLFMLLARQNKDFVTVSPFLRQFPNALALVQIQQNKMKLKG